MVFSTFIFFVCFLVLIYVSHFDKSKYYRHFNSILTFEAIYSDITLIDVNGLAYVRKKLYKGANAKSC